MRSVYERDFPDLFYFVREGKIEIHYSSSRRSFSIGASEGEMRQEIMYCPWTGKKLPPSLSDDFSNMLEANNLSALEPETWPEDWRGENWWKKAGL